MERLIQERLSQQIFIDMTILVNGNFTKRVGTVKRAGPLSQKITFIDELSSAFSLDFYSYLT
jgi:hypothetical protein